MSPEQKQVVRLLEVAARTTKEFVDGELKPIRQELDRLRARVEELEKDRRNV